jgi:branched-chain amino acid transport system ATP-binding protein
MARELLLRVESVSKNFGGLTALSRVNLTVERGSITSLIGPNGAGKTTLFNAVTNFIPIDTGAIFFQGERIDGLPAHSIARKGIQRTFQLLQVFKELTVLENIALGLHANSRAGLLSTILRFRSMKSEEENIIEQSKKIVHLVGLERVVHVKAGQLPFGQQKLVELGRALVSMPRLLLLDEPTNGLNPHETQETISLLNKTREQGVTIFLVAHDMKAVMQISDKIHVLNLGRKIAEGSPEEIKANQEVIEAYLGKEFKLA